MREVERWVSTFATAEHTNHSAWWVREHALELRGRKFGKDWRFQLSKVDAVLNAATGQVRGRRRVA